MKFFFKVTNICTNGIANHFVYLWLHGINRSLTAWEVPEGRREKNGRKLLILVSKMNNKSQIGLVAYNA